MAELRRTVPNGQGAVSNERNEEDESSYVLEVARELHVTPAQLTHLPQSLLITTMERLNMSSAAQAAYDGREKVIFSPGEIDALCINNNPTISLEYSDFIYHYRVGYSYGVVFEDNSNMIVVDLISKIPNE